MSRSLSRTGIIFIILLLFLVLSIGTILAQNESISSFEPTSPRLRNSQSGGSAPFCPSSSSCDKKNFGDANCDGTVNAADFSIWFSQLDIIPSASDANNNANFSCVEGNSQTYYTDIVDYEIWRRNTTNGLVTPIPTSRPTVPPTATQPPVEPSSTNSPIQPSNTPQPTDDQNQGASDCDRAAGSRSSCKVCIRVNHGRGNARETDWITSDGADVYDDDYLEFDAPSDSGYTSIVVYDANDDVNNPDGGWHRCFPNAYPDCPGHGPFSSDATGQGTVKARGGCSDTLRFNNLGPNPNN